MLQLWIVVRGWWFMRCQGVRTIVGRGRQRERERTEPVNKCIAARKQNWRAGRVRELYGKEELRGEKERDLYGTPYFRIFISRLDLLLFLFFQKK